jgi:hypothetical protein
MIVPVQPKLFTPPAPPAPQKAHGLPPAGRKTEWQGSASVRENTPPSIEIDRLVVETATPLSTAAIRDGFREAWLEHDHTGRLWSPDAFRSGLTIDLPPGVTGHELGRRLARAILQRARVR